MIKSKIKIFIALTLLVSSIKILTNHTSDSYAISPFCSSEKCKAAEQAEREAKEKAENANSAANTLEAEVNRISNEIALYEARILANQALAEDLKVKIKENSDKLELQQVALAKMLVDMHFEGQPEAIMILAGSSSISDYAEKQSRIDTVKNQVNLSTKTVKSLKEELEGQKKEIDRIIADQEIQKKAANDRRAYQNQLIEKYRNNAEAYVAEAEAARKVKETEIANEIARLNSSGVAAAGTDSYYAKNRCPQDNLMFGDRWGYGCQCTSYAGFKANEAWGSRANISGWGNAYDWAKVARRLGYRVDNTPAARTVAVSESGQWGHVMWVEGVNSNGTINVSEYNNSYSSISRLPGDYGYRVGVSTSGLYFIHFD